MGPPSQLTAGASARPMPASIHFSMGKTNLNRPIDANLVTMPFNVHFSMRFNLGDADRNRPVDAGAEGAHPPAARLRRHRRNRHGRPSARSLTRRLDQTQCRVHLSRPLDQAECSLIRRPERCNAPLLHFSRLLDQAQCRMHLSRLLDQNLIPSEPLLSPGSDLIRRRVLDIAACGASRRAGGAAPSDPQLCSLPRCEANASRNRRTPNPVSPRRQRGAAAAGAGRPCSSRILSLSPLALASHVSSKPHSSGSIVIVWF
jgi:hypothetical protein